MFVAYYVVMAFKTRESCTFTVSKDGKSLNENISSTFSVSFITGFFLHSINFTVSTFIEPCVRLTSLSKKSQIENDYKYSNMFIVGYVSDLSFRFGFMCLSVAQLALLGSDGVEFCRKDKPILAYDAGWMSSLAIAQLLFIPTFLVWRHFAVFSKDGDKPQ